MRKHNAILNHKPMLASVTALILAASPAYAGNNDAKSAEADKAKTTQMSQMANDAWLDGKLESALLFNQHLNSFDIDTEVKHGTAYLTGAVESEIDKELAGEVAKSVEGIDKVENRLTIDSNASDTAMKSESYKEKSEWRQAVDNATLTATVKSKLLLNEHTSGLAINVDSMNGVVTLSGTVDSEEEAALAKQIASNVRDAHEVKDRLQVKKEQSS
ncbi:BON domain-containing protein [Phenylobacterium sp.]|uniref:BON domain-containing protein n=1 Tax=Phenylobacterium sp. TaxID=1871053 RepID=UPI0026213EE2|nr:BON domain-containing protein [Phenylobacterium sp.]